MIQKRVAGTKLEYSSQFSHFIARAPRYAVIFLFSQQIFQTYGSGSMTKEDLNPYFDGRFVRIKPKHCTGSCALRVEFYGRYEGQEFDSNRSL